MQSNKTIQLQTKTLGLFGELCKVRVRIEGQDKDLNACLLITDITLA